MPGVSLDEESIDEILYLARANETSDLEAYLSELSTQTGHSRADLVTAAVDQHSKNGALHYAAANGHADVIKLLLSYSGEKVDTSPPGLINAINDAGNTPLHWAALNGHLESVKLLIQAGADVTIINKAGHDAVFEAEINDKKDVVDWLLETVEELESGVGPVGGSSSDMDQDEKTEEVDNEADKRTTANGASEASTAGVEDVRNQMEGLRTNGAQQHG
ncbi:ankyrin [Pleomassaria siparia CBS 279.74]|uniref:protein S-acyltransferase n=1 Tax=Pleomassaria siparia CBS 279.74 TaxID=1314801 RepID=A0A6G1JTG0_9PLEO|nr:ankyrin [Pleomassaria siparia CBS 279.74]